MISGTSTDYTGRTTDVLILGNVNPLSSATQVNSLSFGSSSKVVTGIQKLVQKYTILLLTDVKSQPTFPDEGTLLLPSLRKYSKTTSVSDVEHYFNFANLTVIEKLRDYVRTAGENAVPIDEQLDSAELQKIEVVGDSLNISVKITSLAGDDVVFVLPLPLEK